MMLDTEQKVEEVEKEKQKTANNTGGGVIKTNETVPVITEIK